MFTNKINGKSYIGQSVNLERRYKEHKTRKSENSLFHRAVNKYGFSSFDYKILEECTREELNDKEIYYIEKFNTITPNGYNLSAGGHNQHTNKLSSLEDVDNIKNLLKTTELTNNEIGEIFGVSDQIISDINNGRVWYDDNTKYPIRPRKLVIDKFCNICGSKLYKSNQSGICIHCLRKPRTEYHPPLKDLPINKNELYNLLCSNSFVSVAKMFNVTDNTIRKWCDRYNIPRHSSYYKAL